MQLNCIKLCLSPMSNTVKPHQHDHSGLKLSVILSTLCLIHCLTFPFLIALLPIFNIAFHPPEWIEYSLLISTALLGFYSMRHGISLHYHFWYPLVMFIIGLIGAFAIHIFASHELNFITISIEVFFAVLIAASQIINYRLSNKYGCVSKH